MGRPSKIENETVRQRIVDAVAAGNYRDTAAQYAGISVSTFYRWMERGEADAEHDQDTLYRELWEAVKSAEAQAEVQAVALVRKAMPTQWQAAMTYLERKYPHRWGRRDRVEHSGPQGGAIRLDSGVDLSKLTVDEKRELLALLEKADAGGVADD